MRRKYAPLAAVARMQYPTTIATSIHEKAAGGVTKPSGLAIAPVSGKTKAATR